MPILKKPKAADTMQRRRSADQPHPVRAAVTTIGSIAVVIGFVYVLEDRYAHAGDIARIETAIQRQAAESKQGQEINRLTAEVAVLQIQRTLTEQRIDGITSKPAVSPAERSNLDRYKAQAAVFDAEIAAKQRLIDRLRTGR